MQGSRVYVIAEAGVNHNGSLDLARQLVDIAASAGADAVKFQIFNAENLISKFAPKARYQVKNTGNFESQVDMIKKLQLGKQSFCYLADYCSEQKIQFLATPFDLDSVDFLVDSLCATQVKISSGDITNAPLLLKTARYGKLIILSTGMSTTGEIEMALGVLAFGYLHKNEKPTTAAFRDCYNSNEGQEVLKKNVVLLHSTIEYPAPYADVNLRAMDNMRDIFGLPVGFSDHTEGILVSLAAAACGATVIEKHFTVDRSLPGPDHMASLEPGELKQMISSIRLVESALGSSVKKPAFSELKNMIPSRKSLVAACDIKKGEILTKEKLTVKRPGSGISPVYYWDYLGKAAERDYKKDEVL